MAINPMSQGMYGFFGGPGVATPGMTGMTGMTGMAGLNGMNGMNGMNMGMNFQVGQGMYGGGWAGQNNNMWNGPQNNNPDAFSNGMMGDEFGSNTGYGYNMSQQGSFPQPHYPNDDFQNGYYSRGYGRGRGRGRGFGRGRGRSGYDQHAQGNHPNFHQPHEQQQYEIQNMQAQMMKNHASQAGQPRPDEQEASKTAAGRGDPQEHSSIDLAPGGQDEVQEALGDDHDKQQNRGEIQDAPIEPDNKEPSTAEAVQTETIKAVPLPQDDHVTDEVETTRSIPTLSPTVHPAEEPVQPSALASEITQETLPPSMPPPTAPRGPAAHSGDPTRDYGFRGRGQGRYASRGRGPFPLTTRAPASPVKAALEPPFNPPTGPKIVGAPTGPKAMRGPPVNVPLGPRGGGGGFQIVGRASKHSQTSQSLAPEKSRRSVHSLLLSTAARSLTLIVRRRGTMSLSTNQTLGHDRDIDLGITAIARILVKSHQTSMTVENADGAESIRAPNDPNTTNMTCRMKIT